MSQRSVKWLGGAVAALAFGLAASAQATPLWIESSTQTPPGAISTTIAGIPGVSSPVIAGAFTMTASPGTSFDPATAFSFTAWCVDVFTALNVPMQYNAQPFAQGAVTNYTAPPTVLTQAQVDQVVGLALAGNGALAGANTGPFSSYSDQEVSAAVQAAIWKVINPGGTFTIDDVGAQALYTNLLGSLATFETAGVANRNQASWLTATSSTGEILGQGQIAFLPGGPGGDPQQIPGPAGLLILGFGLVGLAAARRFA